MARKFMVMALIAGLATVAQAAPQVVFGEFDYVSNVFTEATDVVLDPVADAGAFLVVGVAIQSDGVEFNSFDIFPVIDDGGATFLAGNFDTLGELNANLGGFTGAPTFLFNGFKQIEAAVPPFNPGVPGWNGDYFVGYLAYQLPADLTGFSAEFGLTGNSSFTFDGGEDLGFGSANLVVTPEPATLALLVMGGLAAIRRRR